MFWSSPSFSVDAASSSPCGGIRFRWVAGGSWTFISADFPGLSGNIIVLFSLSSVEVRENRDLDAGSWKLATTAVLGGEVSTAL